MKKISPVKLAIIFHETYEKFAPEFGYETREETKTFKAYTPNGKLMIKVCREIQDHLESIQEPHPTAGVESVKEVVEVYERYKKSYDILRRRGDKNIMDEALWNAIKAVAERFATR